MTDTNTAHIEFVTPTGNTCRFDMNAQALERLESLDPPAWFSNASLPDDIDPTEQKFIELALAATTAVIQMEKRHSAPVKPSDCSPDAEALKFVDEALEFVPDDFTLADFAADFAAHYDMLNGLFRNAIEEFRPSVEHAGLTPAETINIKGYEAVPAIPYCADRADAFAFHACSYINSGTHNAVRHGLIYSTLRSKGHTPDEIASALCVEFMKG